jgi:hypothetical protein
MNGADSTMAKVQSSLQYGHLREELILGMIQVLQLICPQQLGLDGTLGTRRQIPQIKSSSTASTNSAIDIEDAVIRSNTGGGHTVEAMLMIVCQLT